jgi:hypothetical protein
MHTFRPIHPGTRAALRSPSVGRPAPAPHLPRKSHLTRSLQACPVITLARSHQSLPLLQSRRHCIPGLLTCLSRLAKYPYGLTRAGALKSVHHGTPGLGPRPAPLLSGLARAGALRRWAQVSPDPARPAHTCSLMCSPSLDVFTFSHFGLDSPPA